MNTSRGSKQVHVKKKAMYEVLNDLQKRSDEMKSQLAETKASFDKANNKINALTRKRSSLKKTLQNKSSVENERDELKKKLNRKIASRKVDIEAVKRERANILFHCRKKAIRFERLNDELKQSNDQLLKVVKNYAVERTLLLQKDKKIKYSEPFKAVTAVQISQIDNDSMGNDRVEPIQDNGRKPHGIHKMIDNQR